MAFEFMSKDTQKCEVLWCINNSIHANESINFWSLFFFEKIIFPVMFSFWIRNDNCKHRVILKRTLFEDEKSCNCAIGFSRSTARIEQVSIVRIFRKIIY